MKATATTIEETKPDAVRRPRVGGRLVVVAILAAIVGSVGAAQTPKQNAIDLPPKDPQADQRCLQCHGQAQIATLKPADRRSLVGTWLDTKGGQSPPAAVEPLRGDEPDTRPKLFVDAEKMAHGLHGNLRCIDCHEDAAQLPHQAKLNLSTCASACHAKAAAEYEGGSHQQALLNKDPLAPTCASCHGGHDILRVSDRQSAQHKLNSLHLCGDCHKKHAARGDGTSSPERVADYLDSAHARGLTKSGLAVAATCADCHGAHGVLPSKNPASTVNRARVPETCGKCHIGVKEIYDTSVHGVKNAETKGKAAVCTDCHTAHQITLASTPRFVLDVIEECGRCHDSPDATGDRVGTYYETYHKSYHGQVSRLGGQRAARCSDCHGAHDIRPLHDPQSRVSKQNLVSTCGKCHANASASFVEFDPHANFRDSGNYPILYGVWLYFMVMMTTVFTFFGVHTLLWFFRSMREERKHGHATKHAPAATAIRRFTTLDRVNHAFVAITFFGLTATGIPLVFAHQPWAQRMARMLGGIEAAGLWHRMFAVLLIANFALHFIGLGLAFMRRTCSWKEWLFGPNSLVPRRKDLVDCFGMFRWFFGLGPKPRFDRWTYWEKFDYWAEVGGSMIIGGSGLLLWFPELAAYIVPGWSFNVAMIVHGYEALLAIGFIFTIHFFNAHIRPGTFPVDEVIFTGSMPEEELKESRPEEYERLLASGGLDALRVAAPDPKRRPTILFIAIAAVTVGIVLLGLIIAGGLA
ncbi:MAG: hypothetical protein U0572_13405 [Phycisphaerales bacterium]